MVLSALVLRQVALMRLLGITEAVGATPATAGYGYSSDQAAPSVY